MAITKLNQKNRIVEYPNRYKLTQVSGTSDTYDFEKVTGTVTEAGTAFNKNYGDIIDNNFESLDDKIDETAENIENKMLNISKYQIPSVTQVIDGTTTEEYANNVLPTNISTSWSSAGTEIGSSFSQDLTTISSLNITPTITYSTNKSFYSNYSASANQIAVYSTSSSVRYTSDYFLSCSQRTSGSTSYCNGFAFYSSSYTMNAIIDMKKKAKLTLKYAFRGWSDNGITITFYGSNDNENFTQLRVVSEESATVSSYTSTTFYRYYKIDFAPNGRSSTPSFVIHSLYIYDPTFEVDTYKNQFTTTNTMTYENNQRVLIQPSSTTSSTNVTSNTFNSKDIDTILGASKYYELVYNSAQSKFIAEEVRA